MTGTEQLSDGRFLMSGDESGTSPGDRVFRPDVEGLRAVAVLLVVLFHSGLSFVSGGFVGVDVFFVISGFVITGVLLRERSSSGRTSILAFYGRRCRRIIPAATLVILATVALSFAYLGTAAGLRATSDGRWASIFLLNFHFISTGTNYLTVQLPPSPLQNFWSLCVEEQFYIVYPAVFLALVSLKALTYRVRLAVGLTTIVIFSLLLCVLQTQSNSVSAFFSPFTRAWELALGGLVAVSTPWLKRAPAGIAAASTWIGLGAVLVAATVFTSQTPYPGALAAVPVVGTALIIAGGIGAHERGVEIILRRAPFQVLGRLSYSLYLWHWPILIIAAESAGKTSLSFRQNAGWILVALAASGLTYVLLENPIRHARTLRRVRLASVGLGVGLVAMTLLMLGQPRWFGGPSGQAVAQTPTQNVGLISRAQVQQAVDHSIEIKSLPSDLTPSLGQAATSVGFDPLSCSAQRLQVSIPERCVFGDTRGSETMVLYGDSHVAQWFDALNDIAKRSAWKLIILWKARCPASLVPISEITGWSADASACDRWHQFAMRRIRSIHPSLLVVSQAAGIYSTPGGAPYSASTWKAGLEALLETVSLPGMRELVIGNVPKPSVAGADCLGRHPSDVQACAGRPDPRTAKFNAAEASASSSVGAQYVDLTPWFCTITCSSVIQRYEVFAFQNHITVGYTRFLEGVLTNSLNLGS